MLTTSHCQNCEALARDLRDAEAKLEAIASLLQRDPGSSSAAYSLAQKIIELTAIEYDVRLSELTAPSNNSSRTPDRLAWPMMIAITLVREHTKLTLVDIAQLFSRDPSTMRHALRRAPEIIALYEHERARFQRLNNRVSEFAVQIPEPSPPPG